MAETEQQQSPEQEAKGLGFWGVTKSILWAGLGVQSNANRERDFKQGKLLHFIIGGLVGTIAFLVVMWLWVQAMLPDG